MNEQPPPNFPPERYGSVPLATYCGYCEGKGGYTRSWYRPDGGMETLFDACSHCCGKGWYVIPGNNFTVPK